ncbi:thymidine phosphorylase family protein [Fulvivirga kasyanovii]|uniref:thymidine phosphorylase n=1 Tax=Fulvivirga kasyanovii TaxID=396812 RepID=A0ABW9RN35_9BACT|nr:thymidine phosphorylase family protein [Fulvivirga kasyanovii]MTI25523.1 thymidine phosphorylase family protein [Fulvivirga kasyanovii]
MKHQVNKLVFKRLGINTQHEHFVYMREDCQVCISEGFEALTRIRVANGKKSIVASLNVVRSQILKAGEISLSESAMHALRISEGENITVSHLQPIDSLSYVRAKIFGNKLTPGQFREIIGDIVNGNYSNIHLSAFMTACAGNRMQIDEIVSLTEAMINTGRRMQWPGDCIVDKHCIGGLPGNRTTPIIVSIVSALGLTMPKTSSRAITSPAGTADTMEVMAPVVLTMQQIKKVVEKEGGCIAWGGAALLSPADDILIKVEKALDIDSEGQLIASVLSKKVSAGSGYVIIDMPVGETAKLRSIEAANLLKVQMEKVAHAIGLKLKVIITDGSQPVGRGIGPALEARDVLAVLKNAPDAPAELRERALLLAGELLELSGKVEPGEGNDEARKVLDSGKAYEKFLAICKAQGGFVEPKTAGYRHDIKAECAGVVTKVDNRLLSKVAKLAGAPDDKASGVDFMAPIGSKVEQGQTLLVVHAESKGELEYALEYLSSQKKIIEIT